ncbi:MAG TPA: hypothetical protein VH912_00810 [Streptosporangiaceae bacterium]|jgi:hypothetical protein
MSQPPSHPGDDPERRQALESEIGLALLDLAPAGWQRVELRAAVTVDGHQLRLAVLMADQSTYVPQTVPPDVLQRIAGALPELRKECYQPDRGTWFSLLLCLNSAESYGVAYNFHHEPEWNPALPPDAYVRDFEAFPRDAFHLPQWLRDRLEAAQPGHWATGGITHAGPITAEDQSRLADEMTALLVEKLPPGYSNFDLEYYAVGRFADKFYRVLDIYNRKVPWEPPDQLFEMLARLREGMYRPGQGTWFGASLRFDYISRLNLEFNWTKEPSWEGAAPPSEAYREELELFPREPDAVPLWLEQRAGQPGPVLRIAEVHEGTIPVPGYPYGMPTFADRPQLSDDEKARVLAYLEQAPVVLTREGAEPDLLESDRPDPIPREFRTDGTWIWSAAVPYYLREHDSAPQRQLVEHIQSLGYQVPEVDEQARRAAVATIERDLEGAE